MLENENKTESTETEETQSTETTEKPSLEDLILQDPTKTANEIKQLRKEAQENRLKAKELDNLLAKQKQQEAEAKQKQLEEEGNYKAILEQKEQELLELTKYKDKFLEIEEGLQNTLNEKIGKIEKPELKQLIETSTLPLQERISLADSLLTSIATPKPIERGRSTSTSEKPAEDNKLFNPTR